MKTPTDRFGREFAVGDAVAKAEARRGRTTTGFDMRWVIAVEDGKVYLNGINPVALQHPQRCIIVSELIK